MAYEEIIYDVSEQIATITLNRPDKLNSFTNRMLKEIIAAFDESDADDNVRAVIVTGSGRVFCAGADLSGGGETFAKGGSDVKAKTGVMRDGGGLVSLRIFESKKPVIGAINGAAFGLFLTIHEPQQCRLTRTRRTNHKDEFALSDLERSVAHRRYLGAISFCHVFEANHIAPRARDRPNGRPHEVKSSGYQWYFVRNRRQHDAIANNRP